MAATYVKSYFVNSNQLIGMVSVSTDDFDKVSRPKVLV